MSWVHRELAHHRYALGLLSLRATWRRVSLPQRQPSGAVSVFGPHFAHVFEVGRGAGRGEARGLPGTP